MLTDAANHDFALFLTDCKKTGIIIPPGNDRLSTGNNDYKKAKHRLRMRASLINFVRTGVGLP